MEETTKQLNKNIHSVTDIFNFNFKDSNLLSNDISNKIYCNKCIESQAGTTECINDIPKLVNYKVNSEFSEQKESLSSDSPRQMDFQNTLISDSPRQMDFQNTLISNSPRQMDFQNTISEVDQRFEHFHRLLD